MSGVIRELAEQAGMWKVVHFPHITDEESQSIEKFAELIVQECVDVFSNQMKEYRFEEGVHIGLGDVRVTIGMEEEIIQKIKIVLEREE